MSRFIQTDRLAVRVEGSEDVIYIRRKMDFGTQARVHGSTMRLGGTEVAAGLALVMHNTIAWEGPGFRDERGKALPCTPEQIEQFDPTDPLLRAAAQKIVELNTPEDTPDPLPFTTDTAPPSTVDVEASANGQPISV